MNTEGLNERKAELEVTLQGLKEEAVEFAQCAINIDDFEFDDPAEILNESDLEWNDANDAIVFDRLKFQVWLYKELILYIEDILEVGDDKKELHNLKKDIEMFISEIRRVKRQINEVIENEKRAVDNVDNALKLLDQIRGKE